MSKEFLSRNDSSQNERLIAQYALSNNLTLNKGILAEMGAILSNCCESEKDTRTNQPSASVSSMAVNKRTENNIGQTSLHEIMIKEMIQQPPSIKIISEEEQFYDVETFIEEREKSNLQPKKLHFQDFEIFGKLGEGSFGVVLQVGLKSQIEKGGEAKYAMKRIPRNKLINQKTIASIKLERQILAKMSHPFITSLKFAFADNHFFYLVMESAEGGDVGSLVTVAGKRAAFKRLGDKGVQFVTACTILGLEYLHRQNILYRDLKTENILIFSNGYAKLSDFGLAKLINREDQLSKTHAGTALYNAPEMVLQMGYNKCVDFWALGVFIYELETGETPYRIEDVSTKLRFKRVAQEEEVSKTWRGHHLSHNLKDLIAGLLKFKPEDRLGVRNWEQVKTHPYFKDFDWTALAEKKLTSPLLGILSAFPTEIKYFKPLPNALSSQNSANEMYSEQSWDFNSKYR